jgi:hypothetical protein
MSAERFKGTAYLKEGCPFSFKFLLFMTEAGLADHIEVRRCDPRDPEFDALKAKLTAALGKPASFPTVEIEPGRYESDSDTLIQYYATKHGVKSDNLPALVFYEQTILPQVAELHEQKRRADAARKSATDE